MLGKIEFFTAGCPRSKISGKNVKKAMEELKIQAEFEDIDDPKIHQKRGVSAFPAVKINGVIKSEGQFITLDTAKEIFREYAG